MWSANTNHRKSASNVATPNVCAPYTGVKKEFVSHVPRVHSSRGSPRKQVLLDGTPCHTFKARVYQASYRRIDRIVVCATVVFARLQAVVTTTEGLRVTREQAVIAVISTHADIYILAARRNRTSPVSVCCVSVISQVDSGSACWNTGRDRREHVCSCSLPSLLRCPHTNEPDNLSSGHIQKFEQKSRKCFVLSS